MNRGEGILEGKYRLSRRLGDSGGTVLYEAEHVGTKDRNLVRVTPAGGPPPPDLPARIARELLAAAGVRHDGICELVDAGVTASGVRYAVFPLLRGRTLAEIVADQGALALDRAVNVVRQTLSALHAAHAAGLVHGAVSPGNLFITRVSDEPNFVKILGLGLSRLHDSETAPAGESVPPEAWRAVVPYLSPEQTRGDGAAGVPADVWAVGVVLYETLTGHPPFGGATRDETLARIREGPIVPVAERRPDVPDGLAAVVAQALERDLSRRFAGAEIFAQRLEAAWQDARQRDRPGRAPPVAPRVRPAPLAAPLAEPVVPPPVEPAAAPAAEPAAAPAAAPAASEPRRGSDPPDDQEEDTARVAVASLPAGRGTLPASPFRPAAAPAPGGVRLEARAPRPRQEMPTLVGVPAVPIARPTSPPAAPLGSGAPDPVAAPPGCDRPGRGSPDPERPCGPGSATVVGLPPPRLDGTACGGGLPGRPPDPPWPSATPAPPAEWMAPAVRDGYAGSEWDAEPDLAALVRGRRARLLLGAAGGVLAVVVVVAVLLSSSGMRGPRDDAGAPPGGPEAVGADAGDAHDGGAAEPAGADLPSPADASPAVAPAEALPLADVASPAEPTAAPDAPLADGTGTDAGAPGTRPAGDVGSGAPSAGADRGSAGEQRSPPQARTPEGLVAARLVRIRGSLARCFDGSIDRYFAVTVTVGGSDGRVRGTSVTGDLYPATVRCIRGLIESLAFPPFPREEVTVRQAYAPDGQP